MSLRKYDSQTIIDKLGLTPHPEGGFYKETYRSKLSINNLDSFSGHRSCSTGIYFLISLGSRSHLHRIKSDEMWHFYLGSPLRIFMVDSEGNSSEQILGVDLENGEIFQFTVPAGTWFGAEVADGGEYSLVGCTVSPGFDFDDFEMADKKSMTRQFPHLKDFLKQYCLD